MLNQQLIFLPCLILILLTFFVLIIMFNRRVKGIKKGDVSPSYFKTYSTGQTESIKCLQAQRNFANLHEAPPIFYILCLVAYVTGNASPLMIGLSWTFLFFRVLHTLVHVTTNKLKPRMLSFACGWLVIIAMSLILMIRII